MYLIMNSNIHFRQTLSDEYFPKIFSQNMLVTIRNTDLYPNYKRNASFRLSNYKINIMILSRFVGRVVRLKFIANLFFEVPKYQKNKYLKMTEEDLVK